ncbi:hypothetical protein EB796_012754 [Bugula neritina]|uniref:Uncharacterized protein n=1 Tax=Bugula neritina TaxID=10212 RepID=A0A7J7JTE0_BUGNE|nr:hypothetical protein EB796_012754 [Bugula neritina]
MQISIGADLLDKTGKHNIDHENNLSETNTVFTLTDEQEKHMRNYQKSSRYIRDTYHSMHETMWDRGIVIDSSAFPHRPANDKHQKMLAGFEGF